MGQTEHDKIAERLARKKGTTYNKGKGPDIITSQQVIEVVTHEGDIKPSIMQLQGFRQSRYIATSSEMLDKVLEATKNTSIGVKGPTGHIHKRAGGGKRKK